MKSAVLGCGPAGLLAAHAITQQVGTPPIIYSKPRKSELFGAQYLHAEIPGLTKQNPTLIKYQLWGDAPAYKEKVYGERYIESVSPEDLPGEHYAWDIRAAYDDLWITYWGQIEEWDASNVGPAIIADLCASHDVVISSIPKPLLCYQGHTFSAQRVWATGDAPERGIRCPVRVERDTVVCNGDPEPGWYRAANVFGYCTVEYPDHSRPPVPGLAEVQKPLSNNCDCWPNILHVGRYGTWQKGVLSHQAYFDTEAFL